MYYDARCYLFSVSPSYLTARSRISSQPSIVPRIVGATFHQRTFDCLISGLITIGLESSYERTKERARDGEVNQALTQAEGLRVQQAVALFFQVQRELL